MTTLTSAEPSSLEAFTTYPISSLIYTEENILGYKPGGFHPVQVGDELGDGRYEVFHKLGWGGFGMVWLAKDLHNTSWVAIKICKASLTNHQRELSKLDALRNSSASSFVVELLNSFTIQGPNGTHLCIVTEFLGPSIHDVVYDYVTKFESSRMDSDDVLRSTRLVLEATVALHDMGVAHGDLSAANIAYTTTSLRNMSRKDFFETIGTPETVELRRVDGTPLGDNFPKQHVKRVQWDLWCEEDHENLRFIDVAEAFLFHSPPSHLPQPFELRAPETIFEDKFDHRVDLWRLGCVIFLLAFHGNPISTMGDEPQFVQTLCDFNDPLPGKWMSKYDEIQRNGPPAPPRYRQSSKPWLAEIFEERTQKGADLEELAPLQPIIAGLMRMRPEDRLTARQALQMFDDTINKSSDESSDSSDSE